MFLHFSCKEQPFFFEGTTVPNEGTIVPNEGTTVPWIQSKSFSVNCYVGVVRKVCEIGIWRNITLILFFFTAAKQTGRKLKEKKLEIEGTQDLHPITCKDKVGEEKP